MKKKRTSRPASDEIRAATAYGSARLFFGLPFIITGAIFLLLAAFWVFAGAAAFNEMQGIESGGAVVALIPAAGLALAGMFCFAIASLASAIFDIADAARLKHARDKAAEALAAYKESRPGFTRPSASL